MSNRFATLLTGCSNPVYSLELVIYTSLVFRLLIAINRAIKRITIYKAAWVNSEGITASLTDKVYIFTVGTFVLPPTGTRTILLPSMIGFSLKHYATVRANICRHSARSIVVALRRAIRNAVRMFEVLATYTANAVAIGSLFHNPLPFVALGVMWGRVARVSTFSVQLAKPHLAHTNYITEVRY